MKDNCCDASGKETDPAKAAAIIHKLGIVYRKKSPDKIALIKSAGLFNAAILRKSSHLPQIKSDLYEICQHILQLSKANNQSVCLVNKADQFTVQIGNLRTEVEKFLERSLPKIAAKSKTEDIQN